MKDTSIRFFAGGGGRSWSFLHSEIIVARSTVYVQELVYNSSTHKTTFVHVHTHTNDTVHTPA